MRADMAKVLVERPRVRGGFVPGRTGRRYRKTVRHGLAADDGLPAREGITRRYLGGAGRMKHFNEHLGPLRRFLDSNVGRLWDTVYAEICQHVDCGNVIQKHILTHLFEYVVVSPVLLDGEVYRPPHERWGYRGHPLRGPNCWYVCPKSGLLKRAKAEPRKVRRQRRWGLTDPTPPARPLVWVSGTQFIRRPADDHWQLVTVREWPERDQRPVGSRGPFDVIFQSELYRLDAGKVRRFYGRWVYAVGVRRLHRRELESLPVTLPPKLTAPNVVR